MGLECAIKYFSKAFRLPGQPFMIETVLSPLIHCSNALKHSVFANIILQVEETKRSSSMPSQYWANLHVRHYNIAISYLKSTINNPQYADVNIGANLILAFYNLCREDSENWTMHSRITSEQIHVRGRTLETHPLSLHSKFLCYLYMRTDTVGSNAMGKPASIDGEIARIVYSGIPISNRSMLPSRTELELLLAEISVFQYECATLLPLPQEEILQRKYNNLLDRLRKWQGLYSNLAAFEEANVGGYLHRDMLPCEMGLSLLCVLSRYWSLLMLVRHIKKSQISMFYILL